MARSDSPSEKIGAYLNHSPLRRGQCLRNHGADLKENNDDDADTQQADPEKAD